MSDPVNAQSNDPNIPAISGKNTAAGAGVFGESTGFEGVRGIGHSPDHAGVAGINDGGSVGVFGESTKFEGVRGVGHTPHKYRFFAGPASQAEGENARDICSNGFSGGFIGNLSKKPVLERGHTPDHGGVVGINVGGGIGVFGESNTFEGVRGASHSRDHGGVVGTNDGGGIAVFGNSTNGDAVVGHAGVGRGVVGIRDSQAGVVGESNSFDGVFGISHSNQHAAVSGHNTAGGMAGFFDGNVVVTGDLNVHGVPLRPGQIDALSQQVTALQQQVTSLQQLVNSVRLQEIGDVQAIKGDLANLSARIANLGG